MVFVVGFCSVAKSCQTLCDSWTTSSQTFLSFTLSPSLLKFMSIVTVLGGAQVKKMESSQMRFFFFFKEPRVICLPFFHGKTDKKSPAMNQNVDLQQRVTVNIVNMSILPKWLNYPKQSIDSMQSLSSYQWYFSQNQNK